MYKFLMLCGVSAVSCLLFAKEMETVFSIIPEPVSITVNPGVHASPERDAAYKINPVLGAEGYELEIMPDTIIITSGTAAGRFYAWKTYEQLLLTSCGVPCVKITDAPRFAWRGLMIDPARFFWEVEDIKTYISVMGDYKLNKLHLHLTDNQGWRLGSEKWPKLAEIASHRTESHGDGKPHGGIYTRAQLQDIVKYAQSQFIEVIPEIDMPGHSQSLVSAYPLLTCFPDTNLKVRTTGGISKTLICPANPDVWRFYEDMITELANIFPSEYVHLGGDEAPMAHWKKCPACIELRKREGLKNTHEQLEWFFGKVGQILVKKGKKPLLWFEHEMSKYPPNTMAYSWRMGLTPKTIKATHDRKIPLILAPGEHCYLDYPQSIEDKKKHPFYGWMSVTTLKRAYEFDPDYGLPADQRDHIIGVEGTIWGEVVPDLKQAFYLTYPRAFALSEAGWSKKENRSWEKFKQKLEAQEPYIMRRTNVKFSPESYK